MNSNVPALSFGVVLFSGTVESPTEIAECITNLIAPCTCTLQVINVQQRFTSTRFTIQTTLNSDCGLVPNVAAFNNPVDGSPITAAVDSNGQFDVLVGALPINALSVQLRQGSTPLATCTVDLPEPSI